MSDDSDSTVSFDRARLQALLKLLERMAAGDSTTQLPLSDKRDELDAIAHAVNVLADELRWAGERMAEAERRRGGEQEAHGVAQKPPAA